MSLESTEPRTITDVTTMRALAHPLRLRLLHLLHREATLTATRAGALLGESSGSASFHLRQLAKYGFVEPAPGGRGRERPWRAASVGIRFETLGETPELAAAQDALGEAVLEQQLDALRAWLRTQRSYPRRWQEASMSSDTLAYVTADELAALNEEVLALLRRYSDRTFDPAKRPRGSRPVELLAYSFPLPRTAGGA